MCGVVVKNAGAVGRERVSSLANGVRRGCRGLRLNGIAEIVASAKGWEGECMWVTTVVRQAMVRDRMSSFDVEVGMN